MQISDSTDIPLPLQIAVECFCLFHTDFWNYVELKSRKPSFFPFWAWEQNILQETILVWSVFNICLLFNLVYLEQLSWKLLESAAFNKIILVIWVQLLKNKTDTVLFFKNRILVKPTLWPYFDEQFQRTIITMHTVQCITFCTDSKCTDSLHFVQTQALLLYSLYKSICS